MISLPRALADQLLALAEAAYPDEACALLVGQGECITRIVPAENVAPDPRRHFEVDPATQIRLRRALREAAGPEHPPEEKLPRERLLGHWHSHPDGRAEPSATDAASAYEPDLLWLISSVTAGKAMLPAAFAFQSGGFTPLALQIV
ncbi:Mov34/MPN/PAD-1 family protein [Ferrovibrio sp.]|uniref:Mov34/MPN/PAD-1 family protein n=1 Tax=Ferrovibrio sp. TaxID=1917215 RepID=UPI003D0A70E9